MRSEALLRLGTREPEHLERCGGVEDRAVHAKPIVKRVLLQRFACARLSRP
jgi:hypothetical protein